MNDKTHSTPSREVPIKRSAWTKPELTCIAANTAESGANPVSPEGAFGTGS